MKKVLIGFLFFYLFLSMGFISFPEVKPQIDLKEKQSFLNQQGVEENKSSFHLATENTSIEVQIDNHLTAKDKNSKPWIQNESKFNLSEDDFDAAEFGFNLKGQNLKVEKDSEESAKRSSFLINSESYIGAIKSESGENLGKATLSRVDSEEGIFYSGFFELDNGERYSLVHSESGELILQELATENFPGCAEHAGEHAPHHPQTKSQALNADTSGSADTSSNRVTTRSASSSAPVLDVLVVYTPEARSAVGGASAMQALIANSVAVTNSAYADSGVNARVQLVHMQELNYIESGDISRDLAYLSGSTDGVMDEVHALRNQYGADMVSLISNSSNYCGVGYQMYNLNSGYASSMFSTTYHACAFGNYSFAHELGHNLGAHHDSNAYPNPGLYPSSHGHHFGSWRSVMAYAPGQRIARFSNPALDYNGYATGETGVSDNASTINESSVLVSTFRTSTKHTISGVVTSAGVALSGVSISGSFGTVTTDSQGRYSFSNVGDGASYIIQASKTGYSFSPASHSGVANGDVVHNFTANVLKYTISGQISSADGSASGVVVSAGALGSRTTDVNGNYSFTNVAYGTSYSIVPARGEDAFSPASASGILTSNQTHNFNVLGPVRTVSGRVTVDGVGLAGVTILSSELGSSSTNSTGEFSYQNVPLGTSYTLSLSHFGYAFSQSTIFSVVDSNKVHYVTATLLDSDNDGLSDALEQQYGTNPVLVDTDNDGVSDAQEIEDGTNPLDSGSNMAPLAKTLCAEWNGFLGGMYNILELVNMRSSTLSAEASLYDVDGVRHVTQSFTIAAGAQRDLLVHDLPGFKLNSIGKICVNHSGEESDLDGRMVYYKAENGRVGENLFEFAFAMPFANGIKGKQFVSYNTYQPSLDATDLVNPVANWIQITNSNSATQAGTLYFYDINGNRIAQTRVSIPAGARRDISGHQFGANKVGLVEWAPDSASAVFQLRNVRYVYDNAQGFDSFDAAFQLSGAVGSGENLTVPLDTSAGSAIIEVSNVLDYATTAVVEVYNAQGVRKAYIPVSLRAKESRHIITDSMLNGEKGIAVINGYASSSIIAVAMQYGRTPSMGISYMYGVQATEALGSVLRSSYNTYLNQGCGLILLNPTASLQSASISMTRSSGQRTVSGMIVLVPAHGQLEVDICSMEADNYYGVVTVQSEVNNTLAGFVVRRGFLDGYRFPTPIR